MSSEERSSGEATIPGRGSVEFGRRLGLKTLAASAAVGGLAALARASAASAATSSTDFIPLAQKGAPSGVAALDASENVQGAGAILTGPITMTQTTSPQIQWSFTPDNASSPANFESLFVTGTFGSSPPVTATWWGFGYNPNQVNPSYPAIYTSVFANAGDTKAMEWNLACNYPDGTGLNPMQAYAKLDDTYSFVWSFKIGQATTDQFLLSDGFGNEILSLTPTAAGATFYNPILTLDGRNYTKSPLIHLIALSGQTNSIQFARGSTESWLLYDANSSAFFLRDTVNGVMALSLYPGTGHSGQLQFGYPIFPVQATTLSAPQYRLGAIYFDTTLNKLRIGGATAWETVTSS